MSAIIEQKKFVFVNAEGNNNKWWEVALYDNNDVVVRYGRVGKGEQSKTHHGAGRKKMEALIRDKTTPKAHYNGGCYREIETLDAGKNVVASAATAGKSELKQLAKTQVATCAITQKLIEFFTDVNAHDIYRATGGRITYDVSAGTFRTPLGIVTKNNIDSARSLLDKIADYITARDYSKRFITALEDYLMLIPQDVGRKFDPQEFCGDGAGVQRQSQILDGLEASVQAVLSSAATKDGKGAPKADQPKLFNVKLSVCQDDKDIRFIKKYFEEGRKGGHVSANMRLQNAYCIDMPVMKKAFDQDGAKLININDLWHGSKSSNLLSILKSGFIIPPATASHVCGRYLGNGVYFANSSTKSLNYATSYWGGRDEGRYFMFLCKVAMGRFYVPSGRRSSPPPTGYDSYWAKAGQSGVVNDEIVVFRTSQILPVFLTEWR